MAADSDDVARDGASRSGRARLQWWAASIAEEWSSAQGSLVAAGVAFYSLLALVPAIGALAAMYTMVVGHPPSQTQPSEAVLEILPQQLQDLVGQHLDTMQQTSASSISVGMILGLATAIWSASAAVKHLLTALCAARSDERLPYVQARLLGLGLTIGLLAFLMAAFALTTVIPSALAAADPPPFVDFVVQVARWPAIGAGMLMVAAILYRVSTPEGAPHSRFLSRGAFIAATVWVLASALFATFIANASRMQTSYGVLASAVVLLLWFWIFAGSLLFGVEIDALRDRAHQEQDQTFFS